MPRPTKQDVISCNFFTWILYLRSTGVWYADGRGNGCGLKRYSLGKTNRSDAIAMLKTLDANMAVSVGKVSASIISHSKLLPIQEGIDTYIQHARRPAILGGVRPATLKRYHAIFEKFSKFCACDHINCWQQINKPVLEKYGRWLDESDYAYATQFIELATINQVIKYLSLTKKSLPADSYQPLRLQKSDAVTRFCYSPEQVEAIIVLCSKDPALRWLACVVVFLATTGLRISELASLRWSDINMTSNIITLPDNSRRGNRDQRAKARTTKGHCTRSFPIHPDLRRLLEQLDHHGDGRIIHGPLGGVLKPDTVRVILIREVIEPLKNLFPDQLGEEGFAKGRLHSFRHYFCSACADAGIPEQMLMAWMGHKSSRMIRHYYHLRHTSSQTQMNKLNLVGTAAASLLETYPLTPEKSKSDVLT